MWRALLILAISVVGCGGEVTSEGMLDADGCPTQAADWTGTATLDHGCTGAPEMEQVSGGVSSASDSPGAPVILFMGYTEASNTCVASVIMQVGCGEAIYTLRVQGRN